MKLNFKRFSLISVIFLLLFLILVIILIARPKKSMALSWTKVADMSSISKPDVDGFFRFQEFNQKLYAGSYTNNESATAELWVTENGTNWNQVAGYSSAYHGISSMEILNGYLYISAIPYSMVIGGDINQKLEVKRTADGVNFETVVDNNTLNDSDLKVIWSLKTFKNYLYTSILSYDNDTDTSNGMDVWRTNNGTAWERVATGGFGDANNLWSIAMEEFNSELYIGTLNFDLDDEIASGTEIWKSGTGNSGTWTQTNSDGFGSSGNYITYMLIAYKNMLYAGVWYWDEGEDGIRFWGASDGQNWSQVSLSGLDTGDGSSSALMMPLIVNNIFWMGNNYASGGAGLFYSTDVANWQEEIVNGERGFGDANNIELYAMTLYKNYLYVGFGNNNGAQIWRSGPINPLTITTDNLLAATLGQHYSANIDISSGTSPYTCSYEGDLPSGIIVTSDCKITGAPTHASTHNFTAIVIDSGIPKQTASKNLALDVNPLPETGINPLRAIYNYLFAPKN